ncbi:N-acetyltransferase [Pleomorphomonas sp. JP5]|uniref:GNAT family N-acetyltransferase n=1 Tax=Pleomorphomonas sp. JP5 TaxID=2942998 RepID=UPI0020440856|nr:GNAT family N-acetyltransferase [Pleomorphomonas sp. JP5]MCM5559711.1 GNAT family N-acetyltransferase [Pleomorphomonas sp. JP5]
MSNITIHPLGLGAVTVDALATMIVETVAGGGSVSFMHPLAMEDARTFWRGSLTAADKGQRVILGAFDGETLVGTLTLLLDCPPNQPHRAEFAKMMTRPSHRGQGIATALIGAAERIARDKGRTLIVLDTASDGGAGPLYERCGFRLAGEVPNYALKPHGGYTGTLYYYKQLAQLS